MGVENLLLCGIFFPDTSDLPMFGNGEKVLRAQLHQRANDVGTSRFQTFMNVPQPKPAFERRGPGYYDSVAHAKPLISGNSINYVNHENKRLGGITGLNYEELLTLARKYTEGK